MAMVAGLGAGAVATSELLHWRSSQRYLARPAPTGPAGLIVLGYPTRHNGQPHPVQKWRVDLAMRACGRLAVEKLVFSGAPSKDRPSEAEAMATYADSLGIPKGLVELELGALTTWENIKFSLPLVEHLPTIAIVSDPMHAARARRYVLAQRPDLGARLATAGEYRPFERCGLKMAFALYETYRASQIRLRGFPAGPDA